MAPDPGGWSFYDWQVFFDERAGILEYDGELPRAEAEARALECCVTEWMNRHACPSAPGRCAHCGKQKHPSAAVLPFGTEPGSHVWLTPNAGLIGMRPAETSALAALSAMGIQTT